MKKKYGIISATVVLCIVIAVLFVMRNQKTEATELEYEQGTESTPDGEDNSETSMEMESEYEQGTESTPDGEDNSETVIE